MDNDPFMLKKKNEILVFAVYPAGGVQLMPYSLDKLLENHDLLIPCCIKYYNLTLAVPYIKRGDNLNKEPNDILNTMFSDYNNQLKGLIYVFIDDQDDEIKLKKQYKYLFRDLLDKAILH
jgi:hypothetical protein